jgi:hypothetical protein
MIAGRWRKQDLRILRWEDEKIQELRNKNQENDRRRQTADREKKMLNTEF